MGKDSVKAFFLLLTAVELPAKDYHLLIDVCVCVCNIYVHIYVNIGFELPAKDYYLLFDACAKEAQQGNGVAVEQVSYVYIYTPILVSRIYTPIRVLLY